MTIKFVRRSGRVEGRGLTQVQIEGPSPINLVESAADDRTQDGPKAPHKADQAQIGRPLLIRGIHREQCQDAKVDAVPGHAQEDTADDHGAHGGRGAAECRGSEEEDDGDDVEPLRVVLAVELAQREDGDDAADHEADGEPGQERHAVELVHDGGDEVGDDGAVERVHEHAEEDCDDDDEPLWEVRACRRGGKRWRGCCAHLEAMDLARRGVSCIADDLSILALWVDDMVGRLRGDFLGRH